MRVAAIIASVQVSSASKRSAGSRPADAGPPAGRASSATRGHAATRTFMREVSEHDLTFSQLKTLSLLEPSCRPRPLSRQGRGRAARHLPPRRQPRRRPARPARPGGAPRGPERPPREARAHHRKGDAPRRAADRGPGRARSRSCWTASPSPSGASSATRSTRSSRGPRSRATAREGRRADDPAARDHRAEPQVVDARRDELRAVHDHARQHGRERRAAVDPEGPRRLAVGARVDRSTPTR